MTRDVGADTQEIFGEMQEDLARQKANVRRTRNSQDSGSSGKSLLWWGAMGIILLLLIVLLFRGGDKAVTTELNALKARVEQMEKRAATLEAATKKLDTVDGQIKALLQSVSKVEGAQRSLAERIEKLCPARGKTSSAPARPEETECSFKGS